MNVYVSLIVHEEPGVVLDQLRNFQHFAPTARVVVHIAAQANFSSKDIIQIGQCSNAIVNPHRLTTTKHTILKTHLENVKYLNEVGIDENDIIGFNASNDLLVKAGLDDYLRNQRVGFQEVNILNPKLEAEQYRKVLEDRDIANLSKYLGGAILIKSQFEGIFAPHGLLLEVDRILSRCKVVHEIERGFYLEEVALPTILRGLLSATLARNMALPYIFSEISFLMKYVEMSGWFCPFDWLAARALIWKLLWRLGPNTISPNVVDLIGGNQEGYLRFFTSVGGQKRILVSECFGVKRVNRRINDRVRSYIRARIGDY